MITDLSQKAPELSVPDECCHEAVLCILEDKQDSADGVTNAVSIKQLNSNFYIKK